MKIKKKTKTIDKIKVIRPATLKEEDTGERREVVIYNEKGVKRIEERPIMKKVHVEAQTQVVSEDIDIWEIQKDGEAHEFTSKQDAENFRKGL